MKIRFFSLLLVFIIILLLLFSGYVLGGGKFPPSLPKIESKSETSVHTLVKEVLPVGEFASLAYHYTSVVKDVNTKDLNGWNIPFTTRKYIFTYDGIMKLGIDASLIRVENNLNLILPPIKILSHEIIDNSVEVFEQSQTIFNQIDIEDAFRVTSDRKKEMEEKVLSSDAVNEAKESLEQQFGSLLRMLPGLRGTYEPVFIWPEE